MTSVKVGKVRKKTKAFVIEDNVPIPPSRKPGPEPGYYHFTYPFKKMRKGQSFLYKCSPDQSLRVQANLTAAANRRDGAWTIKIVKKGVRVWKD